MTFAEVLALMPLLVWLMASAFLCWWYRNGQLRALRGIRMILWLWLALPCIVTLYELLAITDVMPPEIHLMTRRFVLRYLAALGTVLCVVWHLRFTAHSRTRRGKQ